jgi:hypothetical protein
MAFSSQSHQGNTPQRRVAFSSGPDCSAVWSRIPWRMKTPYGEKGLGSIIDLPNFLSFNVMNIFDDMDDWCWVFVLLCDGRGGRFNAYSRRNVPNFYISNLDNSLQFHYKISTKTWIKWINLGVTNLMFSKKALIFGKKFAKLC